MPKRTPKDVGDLKSKRKANQRPRIAANGHRLPDPLPSGEILTDVMKRKWRLGKSIGLGGFGEIYLASDVVSKHVGPDAQYVIKVEHHSNGPLFAEMHFYHRVGKAEFIEAWMRKRKLHFLGMPKFIGSGSHEYKGVKYRFMVMERFGEDLQKLLERNSRVFPLKTVFTLGIKILNILEYIHSFGYIHADVKASNLLSGYGKGKQNQVHLVDFGLACRYITDGKHKEFKEDLRKAHDGTIEFTSRDAHIGAHSRRGDLEILGYNMLQWLCGRLPWEDNLKDPESVSQQKNMYLSNISLLMKRCFPSGNSPRGIAEYFQYVTQLKFDEEPDYSHCQSILKSAVKAAGYKDDGRLVYTNQGSSSRLKGTSPNKNLKRPLIKSSIDLTSPYKVKKKPLQKMPSADAGITSPRLKVRKVASAAPGLQSAKSKDSLNDTHDSSLDNPTPAMLMVMQRRLELQQQQHDELAKNRVSHDKNKVTHDKNKVIHDKNKVTHDKNNVKEIKSKIKLPEICVLPRKRPHSPRSKGTNNKSRKQHVLSTFTQTSYTLKNSCSPEL